MWSTSKQSMESYLQFIIDQWWRFTRPSLSLIQKETLRRRKPSQNYSFPRKTRFQLTRWNKLILGLRKNTKKCWKTAYWARFRKVSTTDTRWALWTRKGRNMNVSSKRNLFSKFKKWSKSKTLSTWRISWHTCSIFIPILNL